MTPVAPPQTVAGQRKHYVLRLKTLCVFCLSVFVVACIVGHNELLSCEFLYLYVGKCGRRFVSVCFSVEQVLFA